MSENKPAGPDDTIELDARNLMCPLPVIRTQDRVKSMQPGERLRVICTDPGALNDIPAWCRINGHRIVSKQQGEYTVEIVVEVGNSNS